jgi:hypothetical protein
MRTLLWDKLVEAYDECEWGNRQQISANVFVENKKQREKHNERVQKELMEALFIKLDNAETIEEKEHDVPFASKCTAALRKDGSCRDEQQGNLQVPGIHRKVGEEVA